MSPFVVKHIKEKSIKGSCAVFRWGVEDGKTLMKCKLDNLTTKRNRNFLLSVVARKILDLEEGRFYNNYYIVKKKKLV